MQRSYVARTTINFVDHQFYVRPGDILVHDTHNQNRLTVYRNGQIVTVVTQTTLGITAFLKNQFIEEIVSSAPEPVVTPVVVVATPPPLPVEAPKAEPKEETKRSFNKRDKAEAREVRIEDSPLLKEALKQAAATDAEAVN